MAKEVKLITDASTLAKEAVNLGKAIKRNDGRVQTYLLSEIAHIEEHRNPTRLNAFLDGIRGAGARTNAMHAFVQEFANVVWDAEEKKYKVKAIRKESVFEEKFQIACETMWTEFKPEKPVQQWSFDEQLKKLLDLASKKIAKGDKNSEINMDHYKTLQDMLGVEADDTEAKELVEAATAQHELTNSI